MNILYLAQRPPYPPNKGEKLRTYHQIKFLREQGHKVTVLSPFMQTNDADFAHDLAVNLDIEAKGKPLGQKYLRLLMGLLKGQSLSEANFYSAQMQTLVTAELERLQPDAVVVTASSLAPYLFKAKLNTCSPKLVMDFMDLDSDKWRQYADSAVFPMAWVYQREARKIAQLEKKVCQTFDACCFVADTETLLFKQRNPNADNIHTVENGIDTSMFSPAPEKTTKANSPSLLFTGVMDYGPNIGAVVWFVEQVWPYLISHWPEAQFVICGMNPTAKVKALTQHKGITVTGFVDEILPYYHQATIFVAPFRIARGVQNKILQAFACALPVVSTPMGAEGIHCNDGEDILIAESVDEFVAHISQLTQNKQAAHNLGHNAMATIKAKYDWNAVLSPLATLLMQPKTRN